MACSVITDTAQRYELLAMTLSGSFLPCEYRPAVWASGEEEHREPHNAATSLPWVQNYIAPTKTDENGAFTFQHLPPGIYQVGPTDIRWGAYRGWKHVAVIGEREDVPVSIEWELYKKDWPVYTVHVLDPDGLKLKGQTQQERMQEFLLGTLLNLGLKRRCPA